MQPYPHIMLTTWYHRGERYPLRAADYFPAAYEHLEWKHALNQYYPLGNAGLFIRCVPNPEQLYLYDAWVDDPAHLQVYMDNHIISLTGVIKGKILINPGKKSACVIEEGTIGIYYRSGGRKHHINLPTGEHRYFELHLQPKFFLQFAQRIPGIDVFEKAIATSKSTVCLGQTSLTAEILRIVEEAGIYQEQDGPHDVFVHLRTMKITLACLKTLGTTTGKQAPDIRLREIVTQLEYAKKLIDENKGQPLRLAQVARDCCINSWQLKTGFPRLFGITFAQYQIKVRLNRAAKLLLESNDPVQTVGLMIGYEDESSFTKRFRRVHGLTPFQFRKLYEK